MRVRVQQEQKFLVTTERGLRRYENAFIFTNQSEVDFGITLVFVTEVSLFHPSKIKIPSSTLVTFVF